MEIVNKVHDALARRDAIVVNRFLQDEVVKNISYIKCNSSQREAIGHLITERLARHPVPALECLVELNHSSEEEWLIGFERRVADVIVALMIF